ncbi:hypothetical protein SEA_JACOREN57_32 [Mycobacterium phage JacoRen57]|nr:hypothetical protein SEA_JACOREN57_32 [Mycobacterium phage JacoRen57]
MANNELQGHTPGELRLILAREKMELLKELGPLQRRMKEIHERLAELNRAELILEGMIQ